ncbi:FG-GAP-like repeat-containing protein, partial [Thiorhodococcus drewsii]|uniref:FG-GAP-like repeat-containing protein n=1 Tax=Thiorhodococcus drewsii TaxID=210408 RepID=UPI000594B8A7
LSFTFQDGAFVNTATASDVTGYAKSDLSIDFSDPAPALPSFQTPVTNPFGLSDVGSFATPTFADLDGDGDLDALIGNKAGNSLYFENTGNATSAAFASALTNPFGLSDVDNRSNPTFADLDGDGDLDALIGEYFGDSLYFENTGSSTSAAFASAQKHPFGLTNVGYAAAPTFTDIDDDGDLDVLFGAQDGTLYFENTGSATSAAFDAFAANTQTDPFGLTNVGYSATPTFADLDGDGDLDALIGNSYGQNFYFENTGSVSSAAFASVQTNPFGLSEVGSKASPTLADLDGDGDLDVLVGVSDGTLYYFENVPSNSAPSITSATYDSSTNVLSVIAADITSGDTIDVSKLTLTGEGGQTYTLTSANVTASSDTAFSVTLNATDQLYVEGLLNQDGTTSAGSSAAFNLAAADDWDTAVTDGDTSITTSTVTVSNTQTPTITSATYDVSTGVLEVTGTNFVHQDGATNDIDLSTLTFTGAGGSSAAFTLTTASDVEITDATTFSATLSGADKTDVDALLNANGTQSSDSITYNLAVADDWNGPITGGDISDTTGNGIKVLGITPIPALTYSAATFVEAPANDGTISTAITITLSDDTFAADLSDKIHATNVPAGLSASFVRTSDTVVTATLTGSATAHANADDIADLSFTFQDGAFVNTATASDVTGYAKSDL